MSGSEDWFDFDEGDPFANANAKPTPHGRLLDPVERLVQDLLDEHARSGSLTSSTVTQWVARRRLSTEDHTRALEALAGADIEVEDDLARPMGYDGRNDADGGVIRRRVGSADLDALGIYLRVIGRVPLLTPEDEIRLGTAIAAGLRAEETVSADPLGERDMRVLSQLMQDGRRAHEQMVEANLRLVVSIARSARWSGQGLDLADLIQLGNIGLLRAADKFDAGLGYKFSTYATWWIKQAIGRGIADTGRLIRLPVHVYERMRILRSIKIRMESELEREPTIAELAAELKAAPGTVAAMLDNMQPVVALDQPAGDEGGATLGDLLDPVDMNAWQDPLAPILERERRVAIERAMEQALAPAQAYVLSRRYGLDGAEDETLEEIGAAMQLTRERIRQVQKQGLINLRSPAHASPLYEFLQDQVGVGGPIMPFTTARYLAENGPTGKSRRG